jgi:hypothetical protein
VRALSRNASGRPSRKKHAIAGDPCELRVRREDAGEVERIGARDGDEILVRCAPLYARKAATASEARTAHPKSRLRSVRL